MWFSRPKGLNKCRIIFSLPKIPKKKGKSVFFFVVSLLCSLVMRALLCPFWCSFCGLFYVRFVFCLSYLCCFPVFALFCSECLVVTMVVSPVSAPLLDHIQSTSWLDLWNIPESPLKPPFCLPLGGEGGAGGGGGGRGRLRPRLS